MNPAVLLIANSSLCIQQLWHVAFWVSPRTSSISAFLLGNTNKLHLQDLFWQQNATKKYLHLPLLNLVTIVLDEVFFQVVDSFDPVSMSCKVRSNWAQFSERFYPANFMFQL